MSTFEEILLAALALPAETRAMLADQLLQSLDGPDQKRIDASGPRKPSGDCARSKKIKLKR
jgi:hypothetical protein